MLRAPDHTPDREGSDASAHACPVPVQSAPVQCCGCRPESPERALVARIEGGAASQLGAHARTVRSSTSGPRTAHASSELRMQQSDTG